MRYALGLEYDGTGFMGWQRLPAGATVQAAVEAAVSKVAAAPVEVVCAGRTDSGVHALCQVVHFDSPVERAPRAWALGVNTLLPDSVAVRWCVPVAADFHARFGARARRYRYRICNRMLRPGLERRFLAWERRPLDAGAMHQAAQALVGEHDFSAFRTVHCQAPHARRNLHAIRVWREGDEVRLEVEANAFLHHMVRNIVGSLLPIGRGERPVEWIAELLAGRDRSVAGPTAQAAGLLFLGPRYPRAHGLPEEVSA
ncbi:tRNA pseudouridine(38-40) synthase TruA [Coralloluteibacterium stylophorae]|uniref:tRNA pseudouridine synthase A n=1 Tax=Coralloluteibacterium stylophorae TaxID=1776034 RepID=A0A8J8B080_9GAMM|nr:tRNA pseudouridine(38-40) synthase TruA [Coralloluteibacterium stylophorae]MBS7457615.1 tRNA pseudouridine(38-40) synthase TruA [Coralloluteibacterium stylophorae]